MKKALSVLLALVFFASSFVALATVSQAADYTTISVNSVRRVNINTGGSYVTYQFVPASSGYYCFSSIGYEDSYGEIYADSGYDEKLTYNDDGGYADNFSMTYYMYSGKAYYLTAEMSYKDDTGSFYVVVSKTSCAHSLYFSNTTKATKNSNGSMNIACQRCSASFSRTITRPKTITLAASSYNYTGSAIKPKPGIKDANGSAISANDYTCTYAKNVNAGTATVKVTFDSDFYDSSCTLSKNFKINPKKLTKCGLRAVHTYSGKAIVPTPYYYKTVKEWSDYSNEYYTYKTMAAFKKNVDYTIKVSGGHKQVGTYTAVIKFKGNYRGTVKKTFQIRPKPVTTIKGAAVSTSSVKFVWNKVKNISGYRVDRYNTAKSKWQTYKYTTSNTLTIPRVRAKDADVWIKVYTYKKIGGKVYYNDGSRTPSKWTYTKPVKTVISLKNTDWGKVSIYFNRSISHQVEWNKSITFDSCGGSGKVHGSDAYVYNLPSDTRYYFRAREYYYNDNGNLVVGPWSKVKSIVTW